MSRCPWHDAPRDPALAFELLQKAYQQGVDDADVRICGVYVVVIVVGTTWFYWNVLCAALRLTQ